MHHELKVIPVYFNAVLNGSKLFEIRNNNDRGFQKCDGVLLREYNPELENHFTISQNRYTGREIEVKITYVTNYEQKNEFVVFGFKIINEGESTETRPA